MKEKLGFVGAGNHGPGHVAASACGRIWPDGGNRSRDEAEDLLKAGAKWGKSPGEVARASDIVFHDGY